MPARLSALDEAQMVRQCHRGIYGHAGERRTTSRSTTRSLTPPITYLPVKIQKQLRSARRHVRKGAHAGEGAGGREGLVSPFAFLSSTSLHMCLIQEIVKTCK